MSKGEGKARWMLPIPLASSELKNKKSSENPLDKPHKVWYNNNVGRERTTFRKDNGERTRPPHSRKMRCSPLNKKTLDIPHKMW